MRSQTLGFNFIIFSSNSRQKEKDIYIYIYLSIYINIYRESIQQEITFICKSFRQCLYQLLIYNKILLQLSNLQIVFLQILIFHHCRNGNTNIKKIYEKTVATKLRETILTMTNHNLHKSN